MKVIKDVSCLNRVEIDTYTGPKAFEICGGASEHANKILLPILYVAAALNSKSKNLGRVKFNVNVS